MLAGPFDRRKRLRRCVACSSSHLKCSGGFPCQRCIARGLACKIPSRDLAITIERRKDSCIAPRTRHSTRPSARPSPAYFHDATWMYVLAFLRNFLPRNSFTGRLSSPCQSICGYLTAECGPADIVCAIGALQVANSGRPADRDLLSYALRYYNASVISLRSWIAEGGRGNLLQLTWSTLLLGVFEDKVGLGI